MTTNIFAEVEEQLGEHFVVAKAIVDSMATKFADRHTSFTEYELQVLAWSKLKAKFPYFDYLKANFKAWCYNLAYNQMDSYTKKRLKELKVAAPVEPMKPSLFDNLTEEEITSVARIIVSLSVKFSQKFPFLVTDDLIQEGWKEVIKYQYHFDPLKGKATSWVYMVVQDILTSFAQKEYNKTQKWDDIDDHPSLRLAQTTPHDECRYNDLVQVLKTVLSPRCFAFMRILEKNPRECLSTLSEELELSERDIGYLREELRITTRHVLKNDS